MLAKISKETVEKSLEKCKKKNPGFSNGNFLNNKQIVNYHELNEAVQDFINTGVAELSEFVQGVEYKYALMMVSQLEEKENDLRLKYEIMKAEELYKSATTYADAGAVSILFNALFEHAARSPTAIAEFYSVYAVYKNLRNSF